MRELLECENFVAIVSILRSRTGSSVSAKIEFSAVYEAEGCVARHEAISEAISAERSEHSLLKKL